MTLRPSLPGKVPHGYERVYEEAARHFQVVHRVRTELKGIAVLELDFEKGVQHVFHSHFGVGPAAIHEGIPAGHDVLLRARVSAARLRAVVERGLRVERVLIDTGMLLEGRPKIVRALASELRRLHAKGGE